MIVPLIFGSKVDLGHAEKITAVLKDFGVDFKVHVSSAHKVPEKTLQIIKHYNKLKGPVVFITGAGRSNALSGLVSANTHFPVVACPPFSDKADYLANIHSTVQMPSDTPALTVVDPQNAAMATLKILALTDEKLKKRIENHMKIIQDFFEIDV